MQQNPVQASGCQAVGKRPNQEDAMALSSASLPSEKGLLAVLCDGMGGMANGERFSAIGTQEMIRCFEESPADDDVCGELLACYRRANAVAMKAQEDSAAPRGGATVTAALIRDRSCAFLSVGDSRIYMLRGGGLIQLTRDQVLGDMLDERAALGLIPAEDAKRSVRRDTLVNCLGMDGAEQCDSCILPFRLHPDDRIALMSDGVYKTLDEATLAALLRLPVKEASERIISETLSRDNPRQDNCSVLVLGFG